MPPKKKDGSYDLSFKDNERVYENLTIGQRQHWFNALIAMVTLTLYVG